MAKAKKKNNSEEPIEKQLWKTADKLRKNKEQDYISLTDMTRNIENGLSLIEKRLRNKNTIEFLGIWEEIYDPDFNSPEFGGIKIRKEHCGSMVIQRICGNWQLRLS